MPRLRLMIGENKPTVEIPIAKPTPLSSWTKDPVEIAHEAEASASPIASTHRSIHPIVKKRITMPIKLGPFLNGAAPHRPPDPPPSPRRRPLRPLRRPLRRPHRPVHQPPRPLPLHPRLIPLRRRTPVHPKLLPRRLVRAAQLLHHVLVLPKVGAVLEQQARDRAVEQADAVAPAGVGGRQAAGQPGRRGDGGVAGGGDGVAQVEEPAGDVGALVDDGEGEDVGGGGGVVGGGEFGVEVGAGAGDGGDRGGDEVGGGGVEEFEELGACVIIFSSV